MIIAFDTYYYDNKAKTVGVTFNKWEDDEPVEIYSEIIEGIAEYEPGSFYKRELPCILSLLKKIDLDKIDLIVVDSYVILDDNGRLGLGGHLFEKLNKQIPIIGVAKTGFDSNTLNSKDLLRGESKKPLYVSAIGIELNVAYEHIKSMHGSYRMPTLLQIMDTKTKEKDIKINFLDFFKTGKFDFLKLGQTKEWISNNFPKPDSRFDKEMLEKGYDIWTYGDIELHFNNQELFAIYSDAWFKWKLEGGTKLKLEKWIFNDISKLNFRFVLEALNTHNIDYKKNTDELGVLLRLNSGIEFTFENINDVDDLDSNNFHITSFGLVAENPIRWK